MKKTIRTLIVISLVFALLNLVTIQLASYLIDLPEPVMPMTSKTANYNGTTINSDSFSYPPYVDLEDMSSYLPQAIVAIEDHRFYQHEGIDYFRIIKVAISNIRSGNLVQAGASTITQQLSRNVYPFLSHDKNILRKIKEAATALQVERKYSKNEILEYYLNVIYVGHGLYGVESASIFYFGKSSKEVSLNEAATIAGLLKGPEYFSPYISNNKALENRNTVLFRMAELGYITVEEAELSSQDPLVTARELEN